LNKLSLLGWLLLLVLDQISKWNAQMHDLVVMNHGGVFGIFPSLWWGGVLVVLWIGLVRYWWKSVSLHDGWSMGLIVVGGLGNLIDRLLFGSVRDFIYYPGFGFYGNVADIYLVLGIAITLVIELRHEICSRHTS
jgi:signal peptidase II